MKGMMANVVLDYVMNIKHNVHSACQKHGICKDKNLIP